MIIKQQTLKSNGRFSILREIYSKKQHPNGQCGLDQYVDVVDHNTGNINSVKLYENTKGLYFKKFGNWYLEDFTQDYLHVPYQIIRISQ